MNLQKETGTLLLPEAFTDKGPDITDTLIIIRIAERVAFSKLFSDGLNSLLLDLGVTGKVSN